MAAHEAARSPSADHAIRPADVRRAPPVTQTTIRFAGHLRRNQRRVSDGAQFTVHPLEVASLLYNAGCCDRVVAAGVLHDVIV
ncbi:MAG TPA: hypothetical protein VGL78_00960 [Solirubrobacteraceae bacterium]